MKAGTSVFWYPSGLRNMLPMQPQHLQSDFCWGTVLHVIHPFLSPLTSFLSFLSVISRRGIKYPKTPQMCYYFSSFV